MSAFWDNMTAPRPINKVVVSQDEAKKKYEERIHSLERQLQNLKGENYRLKQQLLKHQKDVTSAVIHTASLDDIMASVAAFCDMEVRDIKSKTRVHKYVRARVLFYVKARNHGYSLPQIGKYVRRDHSTVINGIYNKMKYLDDLDIQFTNL